jgi:Tfp pilus assembly protein PilO
MEPKSNRLMGRFIWVAVLLVLAYIYYAGFLKPLTDEYIEIKEALDMNMERLKDLQWLEGQKAVLEEDIGSKNRLMSELENVLPSSRDLTGIIIFLEDTATDIGVNLRETLFEEKHQRLKNDRYDMIPVTIKAVGAFEAVVSFIAALEGSERLVDVTDVSLMRAEWPYRGSIEASIVMCTFAAIDDTAQVSRRDSSMPDDTSFGRKDPFVPEEDTWQEPDINNTN